MINFQKIFVILVLIVLTKADLLSKLHKISKRNCYQPYLGEPEVRQQCAPYCQRQNYNLGCNSCMNYYSSPCQSNCAQNVQPYSQVQQPGYDAGYYARQSYYGLPQGYSYNYVPNGYQGVNGIAPNQNPQEVPFHNITT